MNCDFSIYNNKTVLFASTIKSYGLFNCLPFYYKLLELGNCKKIIFVNLSLTDRRIYEFAVSLGDVKKLSDYTYRIDKYTKHNRIDHEFYPEGKLSNKLNKPIYNIPICFCETVKQIKECYEHIFKDNDISETNMIDYFYLLDTGKNVFVNSKEEAEESSFHYGYHTNLKLINNGLDFINNKIVILIGAVPKFNGLTLTDMETKISELEPYLIDKYVLEKDDIYFKQYKSTFKKCNSSPINCIVERLIIAATEEENDTKYTYYSTIDRYDKKEIILNKIICTMYFLPMKKVYEHYLYL